MARTQVPSLEAPPYRRGKAARNSFADDALPLDAGLTDDFDEEEPQQFRRASKRVPVKRVTLARQTIARLRTVLVIALAIGALGAVTYQSREYALHSWRFRVRGPEDIELTGDAPNSRAEVLALMRDSVGRNVFQIALAERKHELEKIPWVESATVMRFLPNHLRVTVKERTPVAFVALGQRIELIDDQGVVMEMPPAVQNDYAFPVILGMDPSEPLSTRAPRMQTYMRLLRELDGGDGSTQPRKQYSHLLEEVDLSDPADVRITAKGGLGAVLLHLGNENFLPRFVVFLSNVQKWEQERGKLESVDLRYGREVILNPDMSALPPQSAPAAVQSVIAPHPATPAKPAVAKPGKPAAKGKRAPAAKPSAKGKHPTGKPHKEMKRK